MALFFGGSRPRLPSAFIMYSAMMIALAVNGAAFAQSGAEPPPSQPFRPSHDGPRPPLSSAAEVAAEVATDKAPLVSSQGDSIGGALRLNAAAYQQADLQRPISLQLFDDSAETLALAEALSRALRDAGYQVVDGKAPLLISFELTGQADGVASGNQSILQIEGNDRQSIEQRYQARLNVYSSTQSSLMTGEGQAAQQSSETLGGRPSIRFQLSLTDSTTGKRLWDGWGSGPVEAKGGNETARQMLPALIQAFGRTVRNEPMPLSPAR